MCILVVHELSLFQAFVHTLPTKKRAKVLLFFELTKYFCKKMHFLVIFLVFAIYILLCTGMSRVIDPLDLLKRSMRIYLRGAERRMTQKRLYRPDVRAVIQHRGSKRMA